MTCHDRVLRRVKDECSLYRQSIIQNFTLVNKTGYELDQVYVSPAASKNWHEDILGQETLANGQNAKITFSLKNDICKYDVKVVYTTDKSEVKWSDIDLCKEEKITIHGDKDTDVSSATFE